MAGGSWDFLLYIYYMMYIITKLMGFYIQAEYRTSNGRIDLLIGTDKYIYIIELKFDGSAELALKQIDSKDYALPFATESRIIIKIGANVSKETRNIDEWVSRVDKRHPPIGGCQKNLPR